MNRKVRITIGIVILGLAVLLLIGQGLNGTMVYSHTVTEIVSRPDTGPLDGLRVEGKIVSGTIEHKPAENYLHFVMTDGETNLPVVYRGIVPDTFGEMGEVTVEGSYLPSREFSADFLMAKCPSKYEMDPVELESRGGTHPPKQASD